MSNQLIPSTDLQGSLQQELIVSLPKINTWLSQSGYSIDVVGCCMYSQLLVFLGIIITSCSSFIFITSCDTDSDEYHYTIVGYDLHAYFKPSNKTRVSKHKRSSAVLRNSSSL